MIPPRGVREGALLRIMSEGLCGGLQEVGALPWSYAAAVCRSPASKNRRLGVKVIVCMQASVEKRDAVM